MERYFEDEASAVASAVTAAAVEFVTGKEQPTTLT